MTFHKRLAVLPLLLISGPMFAEGPFQTDPDPMSGPELMSGLDVKIQADADAAATKIVSQALAREFEKLELVFERNPVSAEVTAVAAAPTWSRSESATTALRSPTAETRISSSIDEDPSDS